jgi:hypothetical protein
MSALKLYGIVYEDDAGEAGKGIDEELYYSPGAAALVAKAKSEDVMFDLVNTSGDHDNGPYSIKEIEQGDGLLRYELLDEDQCMESWSVVEFTVQPVATK